MEEGEKKGEENAQWLKRLGMNLGRSWGRERGWVRRSRWCSGVWEKLSIGQFAGPWGLQSLRGWRGKEGGEGKRMRAWRD